MKNKMQRSTDNRELSQKTGESPTKADLITATLHWTVNPPGRLCSLTAKGKEHVWTALEHFLSLRNFGVTAAKTRTTHSAGSKISTRHSVSFIYFISCYLSGHCWKKAVSCCRSSGQQSGLCSSTVIKG